MDYNRKQGAVITKNGNIAEGFIEVSSDEYITVIDKNNDLYVIPIDNMDMIKIPNGAIINRKEEAPDLRDIIERRSYQPAYDNRFEYRKGYKIPIKKEPEQPIEELDDNGFAINMDGKAIDEGNVGYEYPDFRKMGEK